MILIIVITSYYNRVYVSHTGVELLTSCSKVSILNITKLSLLAICNFLQFVERLVVILVRPMGDGVHKCVHNNACGMLGCTASHVCIL